MYSQVFESTDYTSFASSFKKQPKNEQEEKARKQDHLYSDVFGTGAKKGYCSAKKQAALQNQLSSKKGLTSI